MKKLKMHIKLLTFLALLTTSILCNPLPQDETSTRQTEGYRIEYPNPDLYHSHSTHVDFTTETATNLHPTVAADFTLDRTVTTPVTLDNPYPDDVSAQAAIDVPEFGTTHIHPHDQDGDSPYDHGQHPRRQIAATETVVNLVTQTIVEAHPQYTPQNAQAVQQDNKYQEPVQQPNVNANPQSGVNANPKPEGPEQAANQPFINSIPQSPPHVPRTPQTPGNDTDSETETDDDDSHQSRFSLQKRRKPLGINCRGKAWCGLDLISNKHLSSTLLHVMETSLPDDRVFGHQELIACVRGISYLAGERGFLCAWFDFADNTGKGYWEHRTGNINGKRVKVLAKEIVMHHCKGCGSAPIAYPGSNDGSRGYLTFNARRHGCPSELYHVDSVCGAGKEVSHDVLVGGEVDKTSNGTSDGDGYSNDPNTLDMANSNKIDYIPDRKLANNTKEEEKIEHITVATVGGDAAIPV
ncbi:hypothetical protein TWF694_006257 [Orbilia ellipsospora]|uniref:Killer toxin Kp4 domain-containing protein n=1 Tax=Orbilia ellipsospora TaxID=2528407 RepID=A0AAV9XJN6_9PEZI